MTKTIETIKKITDKCITSGDTAITQKTVKLVLKAMNDVIIEEIVASIKETSKKKETCEQKIYVLGNAGIFKIRYQKEKTINLPNKSGKTKSSPRWVLVFKSSKQVKDTVQTTMSK